MPRLVAARVVPILSAGVVMAALFSVPESMAAFSDVTGNTASSLAVDTLEPPTALLGSGGVTITLDWTATPDTYAAGHRVFRSTVSGGPYTQIAEVTPRTTITYEDSPSAGTYYYVVRAFYQAWESVDSNEVTATAADPAVSIATGSYVGDGTDGRAISGAGFEPALVIVRCTCSQPSVWRSSTMSGDAAKRIESTGNLEANLVESLDADGFTVGTASAVNSSSATYYWTAFGAGAELSLGTYVGDGTDNRSITGVGFQPVWVTTLGDGEESVHRAGTLTGDKSWFVWGGANHADKIQALETDGFQLGTHSDVNSSGVTFHYIAWNSSSTVTQQSYVGDGTDNRSITGTGFQPEILWVKRTGSNPATWRPADLTGDASLFFGSNSSPVDNRIQALEADGFQAGTHEQVNLSSETYHYLAFDQ